MKLALVGGIAFVIGLAGGTVLSPARTAVVADSAAATGEHAPADSAGAEEHAGSGQLPTADDAHEATPPTDSTVAEAAPPAPASDDDVAALVKRIGDLPPAEAGPMLARLDEADALAVLTRLPLTRASAVLDAMPREQASRLSRLLLLAGAQ
jgi:hypothetical protein